jgi:hypothetical protein
MPLEALKQRGRALNRITGYLEGLGNGTPHDVYTGRHLEVIHLKYPLILKTWMYEENFGYSALA